MCLADLAPRFDTSIVFPDVDAATLARENEKAVAAKEPLGAWQSYMRKVLPPVPQHRVQASLRLIHF